MLFSAEEQTALLRALDAGQHELVASLLRARRRSAQKQRSDVDARLLVGARVHRQTAERYRACAKLHGLSLYRFVCGALEREYKRLQEQNKCSIMRVRLLL